MESPGFDDDLAAKITKWQGININTKDSVAESKSMTANMISPNQKDTQETQNVDKQNSLDMSIVPDVLLLNDDSEGKNVDKDNIHKPENKSLLDDMEDDEDFLTFRFPAKPAKNAPASGTDAMPAKSATASQSRLDYYDLGQLIPVTQTSLKAPVIAAAGSASRENGLAHTRSKPSFSTIHPYSRPSALGQAQKSATDNGELVSLVQTPARNGGAAIMVPQEPPKRAITIFIYPHNLPFTVPLQAVRDSTRLHVALASMPELQGRGGRLLKEHGVQNAYGCIVSMAFWKDIVEADGVYVIGPGRTPWMHDARQRAHYTQWYAHNSRQGAPGASVGMPSSISHPNNEHLGENFVPTRANIVDKSYRFLSSISSHNTASGATSQPGENISTKLNVHAKPFFSPQYQKAIVAKPEVQEKAPAPKCSFGDLEGKDKEQDLMEALEQVAMKVDDPVQTPPLDTFSKEASQQDVPKIVDTLDAKFGPSGLRALSSPTIDGGIGHVMPFILTGKTVYIKVYNSSDLRVNSPLCKEYHIDCDWTVSQVVIMLGGDTHKDCLVQLKMSLGSVVTFKEHQVYMPSSGQRVQGLGWKRGESFMIRPQ